MGSGRGRFVWSDLAILNLSCGSLRGFDNSFSFFSVITEYESASDKADDEGDNDSNHSKYWLVSTEGNGGHGEDSDYKPAHI